MSVSTLTSPASITASSRVAWVDYAKGWSIVLVVTMHSALGVGLAVDDIGWLHPIVAFAKPFRMPDFFLVAGLFLGRAIDWPIRRYLDRKVLHFIYFFVLWTLIILAVKSSALGIAAPEAFMRAYFWALVEPFSSLWFIQLLPILFVAVRLTRFLPRVLTIAIATTLHVAAARYPDGGKYAMASVMTGWIAVDSFSLFLVYFLIGHYGRSRIFAYARAVAERPLVSATGLLIWMAAEKAGVTYGLTEIPGLTLLFGFAGGLAVVTVAALMARVGTAQWLAYCGRHSLIIYLAFALPMATARVILLHTSLVVSVGWLSVIVAGTAIATPLGAEHMLRGTRFSFLFDRPTWARL